MGKVKRDGVRVILSLLAKGVGQRELRQLYEAPPPSAK
jgi:hypothetical protein